ncbi:LysR substrate-binding domain-containing protein [Acidicapsa dinghuensis]|uniref:LysR substrate-binding domain-containing protein n=1 Tax=Acidicapsa dinghuensis TaxID=2218256 RepID=A0ABW1EJ38_9BACT|nr:LysR substrate-binding domain-containing protein [Acidicapsa dinghuensis]
MNINVEIELRHLRYFVAVAEELHFGRAAQRLHLAQPPLSQQIRKLEQILDCSLFNRTSRSVRLTVAGEAFLERARRTLLNVSRDLEETRSIGRGEVGSLHIGFVGSAMLTILPAIFREYRAAYPGVQLHLHESFTAKVIEGMQSGTLDAGLLRDSDPTEGLDAATIYSEPFVIVLPSRHPRAGQKSISPTHLRDEPFIYYPRSAGSRAFEKPLSLCEEHGFRPHIVQEAQNWLTILRLIGAGLGVSIAPACVRRIAAPDVVCLPVRSNSGATGITSSIEIATFTGESRPIVRGFAQIVSAIAGKRIVTN